MDKKEGWGYKEAAEHYLRVVDVLVPRREEILSIISTLATTFTTEHPKVLDLGCGNGDITNEILKIKPNASVYMLDFSDEMIRLSKERFKDNSNIKIFKHDLNKGLFDMLAGEQFDVAVSCFSLHHIKFVNRVKLYSSIRNKLKEAGLFINGDRFKGESTSIEQWEFDNWIKFMEKQIKEKFGKNKSFSEVKHTQIESDKKLGDKPETIWHMEQDLREAGFEYVDCIWKYHIFAVIAATK